jgi:hypothetical protein
MSQPSVYVIEPTIDNVPTKTMGFQDWLDLNTLKRVESSEFGKSELPLNENCCIRERALDFENVL